MAGTVEPATKRAVFASPICNQQQQFEALPQLPEEVTSLAEFVTQDF
jgi:hypothetical protein